MEQRLESDPQFLRSLSLLADRCHSPAMALKVLGLRNHPSTARIKHRADPMHMKIIYHADPGTLYRPAPAWDDFPSHPAPRAMLQDASSSGPGSGGPGPPLLDAGSQSSTSAGGSRPSGSGQQPADQGSRVGAMLGDQPSASVSSAGCLAAPAECDGPDPGSGVMELMPAQETVEMSFGEHMDDIVKAHVIRLLGSLLADYEAHEDKHQGAIMCLKMNADAVKAVCNPSGDTAACPGLDISSKSLRGWVFFELVRKGVGDVVQPLKGNFKRSDWAIQPMDVLSRDARAKEIVVSSSAPVLDAASKPKQDQPDKVVLSLEALPLQQLLSLHVWAVQPKLVYAMPSLKSSSPVLSGLLQDLLAAGEFHLLGADSEHRAKMDLLQTLHTHGFASSNSDGGWCLTNEGKRAVQIGFVLADARKLVRPRDVPAEEMEAVEFVLVLHEQGWQHECIDKKKRKAALTQAYMHGTSPKTWYHDAAKSALCKDYLLLLATAQQHGQPVPHLQPQSVYDALLGRPAAARKRKPAPGLLFLDDEDVWVDEQTLVQQLKARRVTRARKPKALADGAGTVGALQDEASIALAAQDDEGSGSGSDHENKGDASAASAAVAELAELGNSPCSASSASSSSSSSSSSSDSSSSSSSSTSGDDGAEVEPKANAKSKAKAASARVPKNMLAAVQWGSARLTPTKTGWQATCHHPGHRVAGDTAACTRTRSNAIAGEDTCLRMLKTWLLWGHGVTTKAKHKAVWKKVQQALDKGRLPSMQELDAKPVADFD